MPIHLCFNAISFSILASCSDIGMTSIAELPTSDFINSDNIFFSDSPTHVNLCACCFIPIVEKLTVYAVLLFPRGGVTVTVYLIPSNWHRSFIDSTSFSDDVLNLK